MAVNCIHTCKTELDLTIEQKQMIAFSCGTCRFIYNLYLEENQKTYRAAILQKEPDYYDRVEKVKKFNQEKQNKDKKPYPKAPKVKVKLMKPKDFYTWLKKVYIPDNPDKAWINETSSKSIRRAIDEAYDAYQKFFKGQTGYPRFKSRKKSNHSAYFVRPNRNQPVVSRRHCIKVPGYGLFHLKEKGYIPVFKEGEVEISSGRISEKNGRFYISVTVRFLGHKKVYPILREDGEGIDLGIKDLAVLSNGIRYRNINKDKAMRRKAKRLKQQQRAQSRKYKAYLEQKEIDAIFNEIIKEINACLPEDEQLPLIVTTKKNLERNISRVSRLHESIARTRKDHIKKTAADIVSKKPKYITMEDLNIKGMMKNGHLARAIGECGFGELQATIQALCLKSSIEFRLADRFYPSFKLCSKCGYKKNDLKLSNRRWVCPECGEVHDRDQNAAENLKNADSDHYTVIAPDKKEAQNVFI